MSGERRFHVRKEARGVGWETFDVPEHLVKSTPGLAPAAPDPQLENQPAQPDPAALSQTDPDPFLALMVCIGLGLALVILVLAMFVYDPGQDLPGAPNASLPPPELEFIHDNR